MKTLKLIFAILIMALMFSGCKYDFIVQEELPDPNEEVSFAEDIEPIFQGQCTGCHNTGGTRPDLSTGNAFTSIKSTRYLNMDNPEESLIYTKPHPSNTGSHPKYTVAQAALILTWIQQGAENN